VSESNLRLDWEAAIQMVSVSSDSKAGLAIIESESPKELKLPSEGGFEKNVQGVSGVMGTVHKGGGGMHQFGALRKIAGQRRVVLS